MTENTDPLRLCCCHGHLDGLTLDEMAALGAPCPTAAYVKQAQAEALNEAATALLTVSPHNPNTGMDSVVAAWLQGRAARAKEGA